MVKLHLKHGDESLFLYETTCQAELSELIPQLIRIQNGRLKIERLFYGKRIIFDRAIYLDLFLVKVLLDGCMNKFSYPLFVL